MIRSSLPEVEGDKPRRKKFKTYPIGFFHIDIAEVGTAEGKLYLYVAIERTSKFAVARLRTSEYGDSLDDPPFADQLTAGCGAHGDCANNPKPSSIRLRPPPGGGSLPPPPFGLEALQARTGFHQRAAEGPLWSVLKMSGLRGAPGLLPTP